MPWVILLIGALALTVLWGSLPPTWPVHWNAYGLPDGWAARNLTGVFSPLFVGAAIVGLTQLIKLACVSATPTTLPPEAARKLTQLGGETVDVIATAIAASTTIIALVLPLAPGNPGAILLISAGSVVLAAIRIGWRSRAVIAQLRRDGHELKGYTGLAYHNPDDPRLWVPKLAGMGTTLNFAHKLAWPVLFALLALPLSAIALVVYQLR